ncbi:YeiH family protein [Streptomyces hainanensis]|uniref:Putative sulfate exporter family transporter n=1 Tax=Streptomyces hainanensis TaxID=402648 RepID=A0A4R4TGB9_9ACTN|nr:putative sulfate exporter family transporter [Streptomyces hainanensis]TDC74262.1 putative sulfate exporter family transporter [Streptomyces hainanensis]
MTTAGHLVGRLPDVAGPARSLAPGLLAVAAGTAAAFCLNGLLPAVSALTVAVVLGVAVGGRLPARAREGLDWATRRFLRLGVVLLGLQLGLGEVFGLGAGRVLAVVVTVLVAFFGTLLLGRLIGVSRGLALMVATGFSVCGASAIAAMDSVTESDREDVATAVTLVTLYGSAAIALVPFAGQALGMGPEHLGAWAGLSVHEVAQVVAAASPAGAGAVAVAVVIKLTRVVLLAPMVAGVSIARRRQGGAPTGRRPAIVPLFVVGFLLMMLARSGGLVPSAALSGAEVLTTLLFAAALFGLGTGVRLGALLRAGRRGLVLGALSTLLVAGVGYGALAAVAA